MRGDRLMRAGIFLLIVGIICTIIAISPLFINNLELPGYWWGLSMLTGVGLALILLGLRRSSKSRSIHD
ncbi:MAG: hypothetical protein WCK30_03445 [Actinomycetes bacterium]